MEIKDYQKECMRTATFWGSEEEIVCNMCMGIAGESGEIVDYLKKVEFHGHEFDREKLINELGDLMWYVFALSNHFQIEMTEVLEKNIEKLYKRYPNGFTKNDSIKRVDTKGV